jgi:ribosomal protein S18 acetylase RimI-like enzyme
MSAQGPGDKVRVRRAIERDADALAAVGRASFRGAYGPGSKPEDIADHLHRHFRAEVIRGELAASGRDYWLAQMDKEPAGLAKTRSDRSPDELPRPNCLELELLYVAPGFQRRGVGHALLDRIEDVAADRGFGGIWLSVWEEADWAVGFYRKRGFVAFAKHTFTVGRSEFTDDLMWLPVPRS